MNFMCKTWLQLKKKRIELRNLTMKRFMPQLLISRLMQGIIDPEVLQFLYIYKFFWGGGAQWLSGRVLDSRPRGHRFEPHQCHCIVSLSRTHLSLVLVQPRKTHPYITERLLMGRKESNQTNKIKITVLLTTNPQTGILANSEVQTMPKFFSNAFILNKSWNFHFSITV